MRVLKAAWLSFVLLACQTSPSANPPPPPASGANADVTKVQVSGQPGSYTFNVTIRSPDTGCERFADWWEVLDASGALLYRRILLHSHVDEQPFTRSGGPVAITAEQTVFVRAHMLPSGYGGAVLKGSVSEGFSVEEVAPDFASDVEREAPQPDGCAF